MNTSLLPAGGLVTFAWSLLSLVHVAPAAVALRPSLIGTLDGVPTGGELGLVLQHVFRDATGVPFRRYWLWRRLRVVARAIAEGGTLTRAAHEAGFSSSAHLSASFRDMFGLAPSALLR